MRKSENINNTNEPPILKKQATNPNQPVNIVEAMELEAHSNKLHFEDQFTSLNVLW